MNLQAVSKAIAGLLGGALVVYLTKKDIIINPEMSDALEVVIGAVITGVIVFLSPANKGVISGGVEK